MKYKYLYISAVLLILPIINSGCGSVRTLAPDAESQLATNPNYRKTDCKSVPRIYSGVCLDVCMAFIGPPGDIEGERTKGTLSMYMLDILLSGVIDTVVLPYTLVMQVSDGNYRINSEN